MAWILDEYSKFHGYSPAVVTGKPTVCIHGGTSSNIHLSLYIYSVMYVFALFRILVDPWAEMQLQEEEYSLQPRPFLMSMERPSLGNGLSYR